MMVGKARSRSGADSACAESSGLLPGKEVAEAHGLMHTWMNRDQRGTKMVISVVARVGLVANHCFLGRRGAAW